MGGGIKATVFLNGLSGSFGAGAKAARAFLAACPWLEAERYVTLAGDRRAMGELGPRLGPAGSYVWLGADRYQPETALGWFGEFDFDLALFPPGIFGQEMAGRLAARLGGPAVLGLAGLGRAGTALVAEKWVYSQNLRARFRLDGRPICLALSKEWAAREGGAGEGPRGPDEWLERPRGLPGHLLDHRERLLATSGDLAGAKALVLAGNGIGDREGVDRAARLAGALGADWGVSRPVAMNAWAPLGRLVGVSGAMASPDWALVLGASGAAAFMAGLDGAGRVVAVNSDPGAPIMGQSDLAVTGDCREILDCLLALLGGDG
ncbi:MAG: FAD-binding protein [Deltaproteobacteria bacterium]|nr:FAD-binding protein [Deltaproteobacteria bacterium]